MSTEKRSSGTSGTLSGRLRAADLIPSDKVRAFADEVERLEQERDGARIKTGQWKARYEETRGELRFTIDRANSSEASYQQLMQERERVRALARWFRDQGQTGYARKVEEAVDGTAPEPVSENPFRMPEDRA